MGNCGECEGCKDGRFCTERDKGMGVESVVGRIPIALVGVEVGEGHEVEVVEGGKGAHEQGSKVYRVRHKLVADAGDLLLGGDRG